MWFLECDDPEFKPHRIWLAPGTEHIIGRKRSRPTAVQDDRTIGINSKAVSRKHAILTVAAVARGSSSDLVGKHELTIADCSKLGTSVDGEQVLNKPGTVLNKDSHSVQLASCEHAVRIVWQPVCFTLSHISRTKKSFEAEITAIRNKLEPSGIKVSPVFSAEHTTHVTASKRNVATTLTGLVQGAYIVTADYIDAVSKAVTLVAVTGKNTERAPLEDDFDAGWPEAMQYVPPPGKEPVPRGPELYAPRPQRQTVFRGYTFVMCLQPQMDNLQGPITQGGGKAILYREFEAGTTKAEDFVLFVKKSAGITAPGELRSNGSGPVVVRISGDDDWTHQFVQKTDLLLGQRSILQNEFLDPILLNDASVMRQPLQEEDDPSSAPSQTHVVPSTAPEAGEQLSARARRLKLSRVKSRFKGFDDFEPTPLSAIPMLPDTKEQDINMEETADHTVQTPSLAQDGQYQVKKRGIGQAGLDEIQPTAAEVKRRRIQAGIESASQPQDDISAVEVKQKPKLFNRRIVRKGPLHLDGSDASQNVDKDLRNAVRAQAELEEQQLQVQREAERLDQPFTAEELEEIKNLIQYEDMPVRQPTRLGNTVATATDAHWNDSWNGRKNFKRFRRKGQSQDQTQQPLRANRVTVSLELAEATSNPLGAVRWATVSNSKRRNQKIHRSTFEAAGSRGDDDDSLYGGRSTLAETERHLAMLDVMSDDEAGIEVNKDLGNVPSRSLLGTNGSGVEDITTTNGDIDGGVSQVMATQRTSASSIGKRAGAKRAAGASQIVPPAKRISSSARVNISRADHDDDSESDSSEDGVRFRFDKRNKRR